MSGKLSLLTLNVSGLQNKAKRANIFHWLKTQNADIAFIQETHCGSEKDKSQWGNEWGKQTYWTTSSRDTAGVAILFNPNKQYDITNIEIDNEGRWITLEIDLNDNKYRLANLYAPNKGTQRKTFFKSVCKKMIQGNIPVIMGGDFNCVLSKKDRRINNNRSEEGQKELLQLMKDYELEDVYRRRFPSKSSYTYFKKNTNIASRLDMWIISKSIDSLIKSINSKVAPHTDHYSVEITIQDSNIDKGPGRWMLNTKVIKSRLFRETFTSFWAKWREEKGKFTSHREWWEESKLKIKDIAIWAGKKIGSEEKCRLKEQQHKLEKLQSEHPENHGEIESLKQDIDEINQNKCNGARIRAKIKWVEESERGTKYFHGLEKTRGNNKQWTSIKDSEGKMHYGINEILKTQVNFYKNLYKKEQLVEEAVETLLSKINQTLSKEDKETCEKDITKSEIDNVIKELKKDSSPGLDGLNYEFYKEYWQVIGQDFFEMIDEVTKTECTTSQYLGIIILLYKSGFREAVENWRPITLLGCDYKIFEKVLANRMKKVMNKLINEGQKAYVEGRYIGDNARLMEDIIFECEENNIPGAIIFIDQAKAYDRVEWEWLEKVMKRFNFGQKFIGWITMLYQNAKSTIMTNGHFSEAIQLERGLRQGSPLSSLLYILQAEPFAEMIRQSEKIKGIKIDDNEVKITAYADDTQIYISEAQSKKEMDEILLLYSKASGAKINKNKTEGILLGGMKEIDGIMWTDGPIKALGVPQGRIENLAQFWDRILQKVRKRLELWKRRHLSMQGKVHVLKSMAISNVIYAAGLKVVPERKQKEINTEIWKFLWEGKNEAVKREICSLRTEEGGLGMPNLQNIIRTRQITLVKKILCEGEQLWKILPRRYLKSLDKMYQEEYFLLKAMVPESIINNLKIPEFYKQCIKSWQELIKKEEQPSTKEDILNERLWYNEKLKVKGQMLSNTTWANFGVKKVGDILDNKGNLRQQHLKSMVQNTDIILYVNKINAAIPKIWKEKLTDKNEKVIVTNNKKTDISESKKIYNILQGKKEKTRWEAQWEEQYGYQEWKVIHKSYRNKLAERKAIDMHWKAINYGLNTEEKLEKMKLSNGYCVFCSIEKETVEHLFFECELVERTWEVIDKMCKQIWNVNIVSARNVMFADIENRSSISINHVIQYIILCVKWVLWKRHNLLKHEEIWTSETETELWVRRYLVKRTELMCKTKLNQDIKKELLKLVKVLRN